MTDRLTDASAAFGLRLATALLSALVVTRTISPQAASALVEDSLDAVRASHPTLTPELEQIAAVVATQAGLSKLAAERMRQRDAET